MGDLADFVSDVIGSSAVRVEENLGDGFVRLVVDEAERRQARHDIRCVEDVVIEMLRNARDAGATQVYVATGRTGTQRRVVMLDDGCGVPAALQEQIFEARVTSKLDTVHEDRWGVHGRGMALFSIRQNAEDAHVAASVPGGGSSVSVMCSCDDVPERADQSTWPALATDDEGRQTVGSGPHNIARTCCEFALEERGRVQVFLGSAAEVVATVRSRLSSSLDETGILVVDDPSSLPVLERLCVAADARELVETAEGVGLPISERTAHRILSGAIRPVRSVMARLTHRPDDGTGRRRPVDLSRDRRSLHIDEGDAEEFSRLMERAFSFIADRYYVSLEDAPTVRSTGDRLVVTFPLLKEDEG